MSFPCNEWGSVKVFYGLSMRYRDLILGFFGQQPHRTLENLCPGAGMAPEPVSGCTLGVGVQEAGKIPLRQAQPLSRIIQRGQVLDAPAPGRLGAHLHPVQIDEMEPKP